MGREGKLAGAVDSPTRVPPAAPPPPRIPMPQRTRGAVPWNARAGGGGTGLRLQRAPAGVADSGVRAGLGRWPGRPRTGLPLDAPQPRIGVGAACRRPREGDGSEDIARLFWSNLYGLQVLFRGVLSACWGPPPDPEGAEAGAFRAFGWLGAAGRAFRPHRSGGRRPPGRRVEKRVEKRVEHGLSSKMAVLGAHAVLGNECKSSKG